MKQKIRYNDTIFRIRGLELTSERVLFLVNTIRIKRGVLALERKIVGANLCLYKQTNLVKNWHGTAMRNSLITYDVAFICHVD